MANIDFGLGFNRLNPIPLDSSVVFTSLTTATTYATSNVVAYAGQIIAVTSNDSANKGIYYLSGTSLPFTLVKAGTGSGSGTTYYAGSGLTLSGVTFSALELNLNEKNYTLGTTHNYIDSNYFFNAENIVNTDFNTGGITTFIGNFSPDFIYEGNELLQFGYGAQDPYIVNNELALAYPTYNTYWNDSLVALIENQYTINTSFEIESDLHFNSPNMEYGNKGGGYGIGLCMFYHDSTGNGAMINFKIYGADLNQFIISPNNGVTLPENTYNKPYMLVIEQKNRNVDHSFGLTTPRSLNFLAVKFIDDLILDNIYNIKLINSLEDDAFYTYFNNEKIQWDWAVNSNDSELPTGTDKLENIINYVTWINYDNVYGFGFRGNLDQSRFKNLKIRFLKDGYTEKPQYELKYYADFQQKHSDASGITYREIGTTYIFPAGVTLNLPNNSFLNIDDRLTDSGFRIRQRYSSTSGVISTGLVKDPSNTLNFSAVEVISKDKADAGIKIESQIFYDTSAGSGVSPYGADNINNFGETIGLALFQYGQYGMRNSTNNFTIRLYEDMFTIERRSDDGNGNAEKITMAQTPFTISRGVFYKIVGEYSGSNNGTIIAYLKDVNGNILRTLTVNNIFGIVKNYYYSGTGTTYSQFEFFYPNESSYGFGLRTVRSTSSLYTDIAISLKNEPYLDTYVKKSGDTMTGDLIFTRSVTNSSGNNANIIRLANTPGSTLSNAISPAIDFSYNGNGVNLYAAPGNGSFLWVTGDSEFASGYEILTTNSGVQKTGDTMSGGLTVPTIRFLDGTSITTANGLGTVYKAGAGITISGSTISAKLNAGTNITLQSSVLGGITINSTGGSGSGGTTYYSGFGITISAGNTISINAVAGTGIQLESVSNALRINTNLTAGTGITIGATQQIATIQDITTNGTPSFKGLILNNNGTTTHNQITNGIQFQYYDFDIGNNRNSILYYDNDNGDFPSLKLDWRDSYGNFTTAGNTFISKFLDVNRGGDITGFLNLNNSQVATFDDVNNIFNKSQFKQSVYIATDSSGTTFTNYAILGTGLVNDIISNPDFEPLTANGYTTTGGFIISSANYTIDGITLDPTFYNKRILFKDCLTLFNNPTTGTYGITNPSKFNGIYSYVSQYNYLGDEYDIYLRSLDANNTPYSEVTKDMFTFVEKGTKNANTGWYLTTDNPITLGVTGLTFAKAFVLPNLQAGTGITISAGNTISTILNSGTNISISGNTISTVSDPTFVDGVFASNFTMLSGTEQRITLSQDTGTADTSNVIFFEYDNIFGTGNFLSGRTGKLNLTSDAAYANPTDDGDILIKKFGLLKSGDTMTGYLGLIGDPISANHAANKSYVDNLAAGINIHGSARLATTVALIGITYVVGTSSITYPGIGAYVRSTSNTTLQIDSVTPTTGDRILIKNQVGAGLTGAAMNGVYVVNNIGSGTTYWQMTRATDYDQSTLGEVASGDYILITEGTTNALSAWVLNTSNAGLTVGTTGLTFVQFAGSSISYTGGTGINISGATISTVQDISTSGTITFANLNATSSLKFNGSTVATLNGLEALTNKILSTGSTWTGNVIGVSYGGTGVTLSTGTGSNVLSVSPTFTGTPSAPTITTTGNTTGTATLATVGYVKTQASANRMVVSSTLLTNATTSDTTGNTQQIIWRAPYAYGRAVYMSCIAACNGGNGTTQFITVTLKNSTGVTIAAVSTTSTTPTILTGNTDISGSLVDGTTYIFYVRSSAAVSSNYYTVGFEIL
jgi:hypothetical protein